MNNKITLTQFILLFAVFFGSNISAFGQCNSPVVFNSPGENTFFVPAGVNSLIVEVWGAGGGGGGRTENGTGGGGGGGGYSRSEIIVIPGSVYTVWVGAGGLSGINGEDSWVAPTDDITNRIVLAKGGESPGINTPAGGLGGSSANGIGTFRFSGGNGATAAANAGGGGGSSAGIGIDGNPATDREGANAPGGGGPGGDGANGNNRPGNSPFEGPGGGGGGARGANQNGGDGSDGRVSISYTCQFFVGGILLDDGAVTGTTIIEFSSPGLNSWTAPKGLTEFDLFVVGGGGGGGFGNAAGGGGAGGVSLASFSNINGGQGFVVDTDFEMNVGGGGGGAGNQNVKGTNGTPSIFGFGTDYETIAGAGGGGGSNSSVDGRNGFMVNSSGGGASGLNISGLGNALGNNGSPGLNEFTGGGGGGAGSTGTPGILTPGPGSNITATGGNGGEGFPSNFRGNLVIYAAGGGGSTDAGSNPSRNNPGLGGSGIGGNANRNGIGGAGRSQGSGGGAGSGGGGSGISGVVIIRYPNFRILPVEYLYFDANFKREDKLVELQWATAKEWENSHFEIQRSLQGIKNWELIGNEPGSGWSDDPVEYLYNDNNLPLIGGMAYYRLKQVDFNGNSNFSKTVSVRLPTLNQVKGVWRAFPNPNTGEIFNLELIDDREYQGEDLRVRLITPFAVNKVIDGNNLRQISGLILEELQRASKGIFLLEISWGQKVEFIKIMKH